MHPMKPMTSSHHNHHPHPGRWLLAALLMALPLGAGCGGATGGSATATPDSPTTAAAPQAPHVIGYSRIVDLTHPLYDEMAFWPGGVPFRKIQLVGYDQGYLLHKFELGENVGTHVDAPRHFVEGAPGVDALPLQQLVVPAVVIDVRDQVAQNPDYQLGAADISAWEAKNGPIPAGALVLLSTGWHQRFAEPSRYANQDADQVMHFPGYGPDSAKLLIERDVVGIGIDTLSLDHGPSPDFATHRLMLAAGKYQVENLTNLDQLPTTGATVVIAVLPVRDGSQAQARAFAFVP
ncbi:MAG: cyclase family protein [Haliangiales bacterium]